MVKFLRETIAEMVLTEVDHHPNAPPMPPQNTNSSIPCLPFTPRSERFLKKIMPIEQEDFERNVNAYLASLPHIPVDRRDQRRFMLPEPGIGAWIPHFFMDEHIRKYAEDTLATVHNMVSFVDRNVIVHSFGEEKSGGPMLCGWSNYNWGPANVAQHRLAEVKLVTVTMPMWCFAPKDMADFVNMRDFANPATLSNESTVSAAVKLWARLHDFCYLHDAHYFIVSTYEQWTFGTFSNQWSTAYVAPPMHFSATGPNVVEAIMCWIHSANGHPKAYPIKKVYSEDNDHSLDAPSAGRKGKRKADADEDHREAVSREWKKFSRPSGSKRRMFSKVPWLESVPRNDMTSYREPEAAQNAQNPTARSYVADNMHFSCMTAPSNPPFQPQFMPASMAAGPSSRPDNSHVDTQIPMFAPQPMHPPHAGPSNLAAHNHVPMQVPAFGTPAGVGDRPQSAFQMPAFTPDFTQFLKDASLAYNPSNNGYDTIDPSLIQAQPGQVPLANAEADESWQDLFNSFCVDGESNPVLPDLPHGLSTSIAA